MAEAVDMSSTYKQVKKVQLFVQLKALKTFGDNLQTEEDGKIFLERVKRVPGITTTIKQLIDEVNMSGPEEEYDYESMEILEQLCAKISSQANSVREELGTKSYQQLPRKSKLKHLPHLPLPTFSGLMEDWPSFKKSYESMIHNNEDLSAQDKIKYLIGCVRGDAVALTQGVSPTKANYQFLWQAFDRKYHNKRIMADSHMEELLSMEPDEEENLTTLNSFLEKFHAKVRALDSLYIPDMADYFLFYMAYVKLPTETKRIFDETHRRTKFVTYEQLIEFVEAQKKKCSRVTKKSKNKQLLTVNTKELVLTQATFCILCPDGRHPLNTCPKFRQMTSPQRWIIVKQHKRCPNCLKYHGKKTCMSHATCTTCKRKHHHLLHQDKPAESPQSDSQTEPEQTEPVPMTSSSTSDEASETAAAPELSQPESPEPPEPPESSPPPETEKRPTVVTKLFEEAALTNCTFTPNKSNFYLNLENLRVPRKKDGAQGKDSKGNDDSSDGFIVRKLSIEVKKL